MQLKLRSVGNSVGVVLPRDLLVKLGVDKGDTLYAVETSEGVRLMTSDRDFGVQMERARGLMKRWRTVLHELAK